VIILRSARPEDAEQILEIYRPSVESTPITFEIEAPSVEEIRQRIQDISIQYPWIVAEDQGEILGYAYGNVFRARPAYIWSAESSVYVKKNSQARGLGTQLYRKLLELLFEQGIFNVIGGITLPNEASIRLHEKMGYRLVGTLPQIGFKLGQWWSVGYWQLELRPASSLGGKSPPGIAPPSLLK
jgi:L-amino acid N-acyltransferase YncA